jgi:hypothetical protein
MDHMDNAQISEAAPTDGVPENQFRTAEEGHEAWHLPPPGLHTTGTQLRRRLVTPESIAELENEIAPNPLASLLNRVFGGLLRKK